MARYSTAWSTQKKFDFCIAGEQQESLVLYGQHRAIGYTKVKLTTSGSYIPIEGGGDLRRSATNASKYS
jgi:hypothetical protein